MHFKKRPSIFCGIFTVDTHKRWHKTKAMQLSQKNSAKVLSAVATKAKRLVLKIKENTAPV